METGKECTMPKENSKRYYWLKLPKSYFSHLEQKKMRRQEHGKDMQIVYLRMMLLSIDKNGYIYYQGVYDSLEEELAEEFDEPVEIVSETLEYLKENNMIAIDENSDCFVPESLELIGSECSSAERVRRHRGSLKALHCNTDVTGGNAGVTGSNTGVTSCNVEIEKERELERKNTFCSEPENPPSEPPLISLPLNDKTYHEVFCDDVDGWKELYPAVDIVQELRKMKGWLDSNPTKRKTRRGIRRFINSWLAREQDRRHDAEGGRTRSEEISIPKSKEEIESEIYKIVHNLISREALERYRDKIHELIRLCCPFEIFTQEQIDYMKREWKMEPLHKENSLIAPREDIYYFFDDKLGIIKDDETNNVP